MIWRRVHAVRGAITVERDDPVEILAATTRLLEEIMSVNELVASDIVSAIFTVTKDLESEFPARAARDLGWNDVALMCMTEIPVPGSLAQCIRVLIQVELPQPRPPLRQVYLERASTLRPDLTTPADSTVPVPSPVGRIGAVGGAAGPNRLYLQR